MRDLVNTRVCNTCGSRKPNEEFFSLNVDRPGMVGKCLTCREKRRGRDRVRGFGREGSNICGVPHCGQQVDDNAPVCHQHNRTAPPDGIRRDWYALSCLLCGSLRYGYLSRFERAHLIVTPCTKCGSRSIEVTEERQAIGTMAGARIPPGRAA